MNYQEASLLRRIPCNRVDIVCKSGPDFYEGFDTRVLINGIDEYEATKDRTRLENKIHLVVKAGEPLLVVVDYSLAETVAYQPAEFELQLGILYVKIASNRFPCYIKIGNEEPGITDMSVGFTTGKPVQIRVTMFPRIYADEAVVLTTKEQA